MLSLYHFENMPFLTAFILIGLATTLGQVLFLRELIVLFCGNELTIGIVLASWLLWTGLGSIFAKRIKRNAFTYFSLLISIWAVTLPICIFLSRVAKVYIHVGEIPSLFKIIFLSILLLIPYCIPIGAAFTLGCSFLRDFLKKEKKIITYVYLGEAIGATLGGLIFYFFLLPRFQCLQVALFLSIFMVSCALLLTRYMKISLYFRLLNILLLCIFLIGGFGWKHLEIKSRGLEWRPYNIMASKDTIYGHLTFLRHLNQISLYESGLLGFTYPNLAVAEHSVHFALLEHKLPKSVLLIGGGLSGSLNEILKHPSIKKVDYVELDPELIRLGLKLLPKEAVSALNDLRVKVFYVDGRLFVKKAKEKYDVIILNLADPLTAQLNRFYTKEFFNEVKEILNKDGIFCFGVSSSANIIGLAQRAFLRTIYFTLSSVFSDVIAFPNDTAYFLSSPSKNILSEKSELLGERLRERKLNLKYVRDYYLKFDLSPLRIAYLKSILKQKDHQARGTSGQVINTDLKPSCYFYSMVLWGTTHFPALRETILKLRHLRLFHLIIAIILIAMLFYLLSKRFKQLPLINAVGVTGFTEISLEVVILISFQVFYGYVYHQLVILITAYMLGLALGSLIMHNLSVKRPLKWLLSLQAGLGVFCALLIGVIFLLYIHKELAHHKFITHVFFPMVLVIAGMLGGMQFLAASESYITSGKKVRETAAILYGTDLIGSATGAFLTSLILLPVLGIPATLTALASLNLFSFLLLFSSIDQIPGIG